MKKEKMIEELRKIAEVLAGSLCRKGLCTQNQCTIDDCDLMTQAKEIYDNGYRKVPEGAVVLTKEEYDKLGLFGETVQEYKSDNGQPILVKEQKKLKKYPTDIADFIQKKTVKEFVEKLKEKAYTNNYCQEVILKSDIDRLLKEYEK